MLDPKGNTGIYLIYSYVRICSIIRKAGLDEENLSLDELNLEITNSSTRDLTMTLLRLPEAIEQASKDLMVNRLTDQLYEISTRIGEFYHNNKVIGSED